MIETFIISHSSLFDFSLGTIPFWQPLTERSLGRVSLLFERFLTVSFLGLFRQPRPTLSRIRTSNDPKPNLFQQLLMFLAINFTTAERISDPVFISSFRVVFIRPKVSPGIENFYFSSFLRPKNQNDPTFASMERQGQLEESLCF